MKGKNSWIRQLGILYILGIPLLLEGGKIETIGAVVIGFMLSMAFLPAINRIEERPLRPVEQMILKVASFGGMILAIGGIIRVAWWYAQAIQGMWICAALAVAGLLVGRSRGERGRDAMASIWEKVVGIGIFFMLIFQIPNFEGFTKTLEVGQGIQWEMMLRMGGSLFLINIPYYLAPLYRSDEVKDGIKRRRERFLSHCLLWGILGITVVLMVGTWEIKVLQIVQFPFMLMGQSGIGFQGESVRLEALSFMISIVLLYFSAGTCMDGWRAIRKKSDSQYRGKDVITVTAAGLIAGLICSGCSAKLAEKQLVLIGDEAQLAQRKETVELSSMRILIIHSTELEQIVTKVLALPDVSMAIPVAYSAEELHQQMGEIMENKSASDAMKYVEELVRPGTQISTEEYITIREVLNRWATGETVILPTVSLNKEQLQVDGNVKYQNGSLLE